jgi:hypothetical protein
MTLPPSKGGCQLEGKNPVSEAYSFGGLISYSIVPIPFKKLQSIIEAQPIRGYRTYRFRIAYFYQIHHLYVKKKSAIPARIGKIGANVKKKSHPEWC